MVKRGETCTRMFLWPTGWTYYSLGSYPNGGFAYTHFILLFWRNRRDSNSCTDLHRPNTFPTYPLKPLEYYSKKKGFGTIIPKLKLVELYFLTLLRVLFSLIASTTVHIGFYEFSVVLFSHQVKPQSSL